MKPNTINVLGLLAGIAAGSVVALLMAPDSGRATRKKLAKKAAKIKDRVKDKAQQYTGNSAVAAAVSNTESLYDSAARNL